MDAMLHNVWLAPVTTQKQEPAPDVAACLGGSGSVNGGHMTPLKPLLTPSLLQSGASREREANLLEFFPNSVRAPAAEAKLNSPMYLPPQPVFLAGFGNYTHREANEIWRRPLSLTVTTAAEIGWGTLLFFSLAARHTQHYTGASALHGHAKKAMGLLR